MLHSRMPPLLLALCLGASIGACERTDTDTGTNNEDPGSLCACRELDDDPGTLECCFGHGECVEQPDGPSTCACEPGARGELCSTPAPGVRAPRARTCEDDDPGCTQLHDLVQVEAFDECVDLDGAQFESVLVRPAADTSGAWPEAAAGFPVALLVHGASQHASDYYDLLEHLAANGIVAAALEATAGEDVTFRANRLLSYLECLRGQWPEAARLSDRYAFIGHSRGGSAIAVAAEAMAAGLAAPGVELEALVALAPARSGQFAVTPAMTPAYLSLSGARDSDTQGAALGWFDLAGDGDPSLLRSVVWLHGATHQRFHQGLLFSGTGDSQASLASDGHWAAARAYIGAFLLWRLREREELRALFTGERVPASLAVHYPDSAAPGVFAGLHQASEAQLVLHDFAADALSPSPLDAPVSAEGFSAVKLGPLAELDAPWSGAHLGTGLRLDWEAGAPAILRVELPPDQRDLSAYAALSLPLARSFDAPETCAAPGPLAALSLVLHGASRSIELPLSTLGEAGRVEAPDRVIPESFGNWVTPECHAQDFVRPLRVPLALACDAGLDLSEVLAIELRVDASAAGGLLVGALALERGIDEAPGCP